ncbi:MAG: hypothetical protein ACOCV3_02790 [Halanaerobiales bacterium]
MEVKKIFKSSQDDEIIYLLKGGRKVIKRNRNRVKKLDLNEWDDINFIPEHFQEKKREVTTAEKKQLQKFLDNNKKSSKRLTIFNKIRNLFKE